jgi:hypothetical protein
LASGKELLTVASATAVNVTAVGVVAVTAGTISVSIMAVTTARANIPSFNRENLIVFTLNYVVYIMIQRWCSLE